MVVFAQTHIDDRMGLIKIEHLVLMDNFQRDIRAILIPQKFLQEFALLLFKRLTQTHHDQVIIFSLFAKGKDVIVEHFGGI